MRRLSRACACRALVSALQLAGAEAPLARVRVPRAGAKMDQHQAIEIPRFRDRQTGDNRAAKAVGQGCAASGEAPGQMRPLYVFMECPVKKVATARAPTRIEELRLSGRHGVVSCHSSLPDQMARSRRLHPFQGRLRRGTDPKWTFTQPHPSITRG